MDGPVSVNSRTGYVIMVANSPILWHSKLQSETTLSTMKTEIIVLAYSCCNLFPIMHGVSIMVEAIGLPVGHTIIQVLIHKDNAGALDLAKTLPPQFTSQRMHQRLFGFERRL